MGPVSSKESFGSRVLRKSEQQIGNRAPTRPPTRLESYRTTLMNLDDYLPQPEEDHKIASKVQQLQNLIEAHAIYHYYNNRPLDLKPEDVQSLLKRRLFSEDNEDTNKRLALNLHTTSHRATFIRIVLARALIAAIDLQGNPATSLLPQEIVLFMIAFKNSPRSKDNDQVDEVALCEWRRLGSYLLSNAQNRTNQLQNTASRVDSMVGWLDDILCIFAEPEHIGDGSTRRLGNLRSIVTLATEIGVLLFGQACIWEFDWTVRPTNDSDEITTNAAYRPLSRQSSQQPDTSNPQSPTSFEKVQPETPKEPRKRRRRFQDLARSRSSKAKGRERDKPRKDNDRPPLTASVLRFSPSQIKGESEAGLYRTRTGEGRTQYMGQHLEPSHHQQHEDRRAENSGNRGLSQRSRSEPHFAPVDPHESIQYRDTFENSKPPTETIMHEAEDSFAYKEELEDTASSTTRNGYISDPLQSGQSRLPTAPGQSTHNHTEESFFVAPGYGTSISNSHPNRPREQSRSAPERKYSTNSRQSVEHTRPIPELKAPIRPSRPIVYFPALLKVGDEYGCRMTQPLLVLESMVDRACLTAFY